MKNSDGMYEWIFETTFNVGSKKRPRCLAHALTAPCSHTPCNLTIKLTIKTLFPLPATLQREQPGPSEMWF